MPHPLLLGAVMLGSVATWRLLRREQRRITALLDRHARESEGPPPAPIRLERDPQTGVYRPAPPDSSP